MCVVVKKYAKVAAVTASPCLSVGGAFGSTLCKTAVYHVGAAASAGGHSSAAIRAASADVIREKVGTKDPKGRKYR